MGFNVCENLVKNVLRNMKYLTLSAVVLSIAASSCEKEDLSGLKQSAFNQAFEAKINEKVLIKNQDQALTLQISSIIDNRCPVHTEPCEDEGNCATRIKITNGNNSWTETVLTIGNSTGEQKDAISVILDGKAYEISLNGVNPKPSINSSQDKAAGFIVKPGLEKQPDLEIF